MCVCVCVCVCVCARYVELIQGTDLNNFGCILTSFVILVKCVSDTFSS